MVKTYSLSANGKNKVSEHFYVYEFSSTSPSPYNPTKTYTNNVLISDELLYALEALYKTLNAKEAKISSGYRCKEHDIAVGGSGVGQHLLGKAVDICFINKEGKYIDTKILSCIAQELQLFNGIARITNNFIHLDVGNRSVPYYGDETKSYNTVTRDFYSYYGLTKAQVHKYIVNNTYLTNKTEKEKPTISYQVYTNKWLPPITNSDLTTVYDYAGIENNTIHGLRINVSNGSIKYRVHIKEVNSWTQWLDTSKSNKDDFVGSTISNLTIDGIQIDNNGSNYNVYYKVSPIGENRYYPIVKNTEDYAGVFGKGVDKIVIYLDK